MTLINANQELFKAAHTLARKLRQPGDNYQILFTCALREIRAHIATNGVEIMTYTDDGVEFYSEPTLQAAWSRAESLANIVSDFGHSVIVDVKFVSVQWICWNSRTGVDAIAMDYTPLAYSLEQSLTNPATA